MRFWPFADALARSAPTLVQMADPPKDMVELGNAAQQLLQDPVFRLAMERVEAGLIDRWRLSPIGAAVEREAVYQLHAAVTEIRAELTRMVAAGRQRRAA